MAPLRPGVRMEVSFNQGDATKADVQAAMTHCCRTCLLEQLSDINIVENIANF